MMGYIIGSTHVIAPDLLTAFKLYLALHPPTQYTSIWEIRDENELNHEKINEVITYEQVSMQNE